jgi:hypothetical protein
MVLGMTDYLQPILGTTTRNPSFSVSKHSQTGDYPVYFGVEFFEVVPSNQESTQLKLMLAHLNNVGVVLRQ